ncbi:hypothetical protein [Micromonospora chokoriensis]|uniref:hypothetical protein n=1 Tax=Micromonospora chokoriensis TaxID=356851 RepID=UPI00068AE633|nr:hypothetical protein [Micromonospora chokoriensis]
MTAPKVLGLDLSLTCTGVAGNGWTDTIEPVKRGAAFRDRKDKTRDRQLRDAYRHHRLRTIRQPMSAYLGCADLVVMEGLAFDAHDTDRQQAGLSWMVRDSLWHWEVPYAVVSPSVLKQFVTGDAFASKDDVKATIADWFAWFDGGHDEADAAGLMAMGYAHLGMPLGPLLEHQVTALGKAAWPEMPAPCAHEWHGADGGRCPGCGWDSHPIPAGPTPPIVLDDFPDVALVPGQAGRHAGTHTIDLPAQEAS